MATYYVSDPASLTAALASAETSIDIIVTSDFTMTATKALPTGKNITITSGAGGPYVITRGVTGDLFSLPANTTLALSDIVIDGNYPTYANAGGSLFLVNGANAYLTLDAGAVLRNNTTTSTPGGTVTGGIRITNGTVEMNPGSLVTHTTADGGIGGIGAFGANSRLIMNGGTLSYISGRYGGAVYTDASGTFTMYGGVIEYNQSAPGVAGAHGAGVDVTGTFTMYGGTIQYNRSPEGAGVAIHNTGIVNIYAGNFIGNVATSATGHGGAILFYQSPNNNVNIGMTGGEVNFIGNISEGVAGAIGTSTAGGKNDLQKLFVGPNVIFRNNESTSGRFMTDPADIALHESHILATVFTQPFVFGYNDFDIQYADGDPAVIYTVSFDAPGQSFNNQRVPEGGTALNPAPVAGCDIYGTVWYADPAYTVPWDFANPIGADTTLYGREEFVSCADHQVRFNANGGSVVPAQTVETGQPAAEPAPPTRGCDIFGGWYLDAALTMPYNFATPVYTDMTLFARWIPSACPGAQVQVTFDTNGGTAIPPQVVPAGSPAAEPAPPERGCDIFAGWYEDTALTIPWSFETPVTAPITLYADWIPNDCPEGLNLVRFDTEGGESVPPQVLEGGQTVTQPPDPIRGCDIFAGWYADPALTVPYDFSAPVYEPATLYAAWIPNECPPRGSYTVRFNSNGGTAVAPQAVAEGETAAKPAPPTRGCDIFMGWYLNPALTVPYDFATPVTGDITLYAAWTPHACPPPPPGAGPGVALLARVCGARLRPGMFAFGVFGPSGSEAARASNNRCGTVVFPAIALGRAGTYLYTIRALGGCPADARAYRVRVTVTDDGQGNLSARVNYLDGMPCFVCRCCGR